MSISDFYGLTPRQFDNILTGYRRKQERDLQNSWEQTRHLMYATLLPHQKRNKQGKVVTPMKLTDVMVFPWDQEHKPSPKVTEQEALDFWRKVDQKK